MLVLAILARHTQWTHAETLRAEYPGRISASALVDALEVLEGRGLIVSRMESLRLLRRRARPIYWSTPMGRMLCKSSTRNGKGGDFGRPRKARAMG